MPLYKFLIYFSFCIIFCNCVTKKNKSEKFIEKGLEAYSIKQIAKLPSKIDESSGLAWADDSTLYTVNDGGGKASLYRINLKGKFLQELNFPHLENRDWEELTRDNKGNIYIGDIGDNLNYHDSSMVYKFHPTHPEIIDTITFKYSDQILGYQNRSRFKHNFDSEAMFWMDEKLYIFSKNRDEKWVKYYVIPARKGNYIINPSPQKILLESMVTGADIRKDKKQFVLLSYNRVYFFDLKDEQNLFAYPSFSLKMSRGQTEAIVYKNDKEFIITNEQSKMFSLKLK